jgi:hypothetical protein
MIHDLALRDGAQRRKRGAYYSMSETGISYYGLFGEWGGFL